MAAPRGFVVGVRGILHGGVFVGVAIRDVEAVVVVVVVVMVNLLSLAPGTSH
jgi:hypothetical protein